MRCRSVHKTTTRVNTVRTIGAKYELRLNTVDFWYLLEEVDGLFYTTCIGVRLYLNQVEAVVAAGTVVVDNLTMYELDNGRAPRRCGATLE